jgi:1-acyl-sn-glycerol-3-phosphate acyltransferase
MNRFENWVPPPEVEFAPFNLVQWLRISRRAIPFAILVFGGLLILLLVRLIEAPFFRLRRPVTPSITKFVCRNSLRIIGLRYLRTGDPMRHAGAMVANHSSWLDIFVLNAGQRLYFGSKSEVAKWPGIGWLARATGTVFIRRNRADAKAQTKLFEDRLLAGHKLLFFPEGTSTDGLQVIPFKTTLFQAFMTPRVQSKLWIQPVTLLYLAPDGREMSFYGWWGDMDFVPHLLYVLAAKRQGAVSVTYHAPIAVTDFTDRKALALECEMRVRSGAAL